MKLLSTLFADVRMALSHGLQVLFFVSAIIMVAAVVLNALLREVPLRGRVTAPGSPGAVPETEPATY